MATVILSRGALSIVAKEYYQKLDKTQEHLFAYIYHLDKCDEEQARQAFNDFIENGDLATKARQIFLQKYRDWEQWQGEKQHENKIHRL